MDNKISELASEKASVAALGAKLHWLFLILFVLYCAVFAFVGLYALFPPEGFTSVGPSSILALIPIAANLAAGGIALFLVSRMMKSISKGASPFSREIARRSKILGILLLLGVVAGMFIDPGTQIGSVTSHGGVFHEFEGNKANVVYIDTSSLFISIICFALSTIFRYGAILQAEVDELV